MSRILVCDSSEIIGEFGKFGNVFMNLAPTTLTDILLGKTRLKEMMLMERDKAETDHKYMQLIPYVVFMNDRDEILKYVRTSDSGEARLRGASSIGFGGHIEESDAEKIDSKEDFLFMYINGAVREIKEELGLEIDKNRFMSSVVAAIGDFTDDVGKVHLGFLHVIRLSDSEVESIGKFAGIKEHSELEFLSQAKIDEIFDELETWSKLSFIGMTKKNKMVDHAHIEKMGGRIERVTELAKLMHDTTAAMASRDRDEWCDENHMKEMADRIQAMLQIISYMVFCGDFGDFGKKMLIYGVVGNDIGEFVGKSKYQDAECFEEFKRATTTIRESL